ncbi:hypothetical protein ACQ86G_15830 [Roseateles chitinivorans]|uniref:hypothetical protein n=1 Tax=Roseateles chitinivorans TaxID=2917965 RepID=UPI003D665506
MERAVWAISEILGGHDETRAARKWRAAELDALLPGPWAYPFYAVLEVSSFWERWGKELPGPLWTAEIYISNATGEYQEYLDEVLDQCRVWLQGEMLELGSPAPA